LFPYTTLFRSIRIQHSGEDPCEGKEYNCWQDYVNQTNCQRACNSIETTKKQRQPPVCRHHTTSYGRDHYQQNEVHHDAESFRYPAAVVTCVLLQEDRDKNRR